MSSFFGCRSLVAARGLAQTRPPTRRRPLGTSPAEALSARRQAPAPCRRRSKAPAHGPLVVGGVRRDSPVGRSAARPSIGASTERSCCNFRCERRECPRPGGRREGRSPRSSRPTLGSETRPGGPPREGTRGDPPSPLTPRHSKITQVLANRIRGGCSAASRGGELEPHGADAGARGVRRGAPWLSFSRQAGDGARTHDPQLGKLMLYQLSYARVGSRC